MLHTQGSFPLIAEVARRGGQKWPISNPRTRSIDANIAPPYYNIQCRSEYTEIFFCLNGACSFELISYNIMFFSHNKSMNSTFQSGFSAKLTGPNTRSYIFANTWFNKRTHSAPLRRISCSLQRSNRSPQFTILEHLHQSSHIVSPIN